MGKRWNIVGSICIMVAAFVLILDARTASKGVQEGMTLCMEAVIPALFPFMFLSGMLNRILVGYPLSILRPLGRLLRIPAGAEGLVLAGLVGGYPIGAKLIQDAYRSGNLSRQDCKRMLGFCNQAGPAFLFGMLGPIVKPASLIWLIWGLQLISAFITGMLLPGKSQGHCVPSIQNKANLATSLGASIRTIATVCGWVIVFRVILAFAARWFLWAVPLPVQILFTGILELSNGCAALTRLESITAVMILAGVILSFGGVCVMMQTISVCGDLGTGLYFPGKVLQVSINCLLSIIAAHILYPQASVSIYYSVIPVTAIVVSLVFLYRKKVVAFLRRMLYNNVSYVYERG